MPETQSDQERSHDRQPDGGEDGEARRIRQHTEDLLDEALKETFPASDPTSIAMPAERRKQ
jgi:hypothetical protein